MVHHLAISTDLGINWKYVDPNSLKPHGYHKTGNLNHVTCNKNFCLSIGHYFFVNEDRPGLLLVESSDGGLTWAIPKSITSNQPADFYAGSFTGVDIASFSNMQRGSLLTFSLTNY